MDHGRPSHRSARANPSQYSALFVVAHGLANVTKVRTEINGVGYSTSAPESLITQVQRYVHVVELVLAGIGAIALAIAGLGISNAMLAAIRERRREIGVLKAVGATDRDVRRVFLVEAGTLGFVGGALGAITGLLIARVPRGRRQPVPLEPESSDGATRCSSRAPHRGGGRCHVVGARGGNAARDPCRTDAGAPGDRRRLMHRLPVRATVAVVAILALAACSGSGRRKRAGPSTSGIQATQIVVAIGDSATEGDGVPDRLQNAWPYLVFRNALPISAALVNGALDDATVADAIVNQAPLVQELQPDIVAVWLGADDLRASTPVPTFALAFARLLETLQSERSPRILVADIPEAYGRGAAAYNTAIADVVVKAHAELVPLAHAAIALAPSEGLAPQPDARSHRVVADAFARAIARASTP